MLKYLGWSSEVLVLDPASGLVMMVDGDWQLRLVVEVGGSLTTPGWLLAAN